MTVDEITKELDENVLGLRFPSTEHLAKLAKWIQKYGEDEYSRGRREAISTFPPPVPGQGSKL